MKIKKYIEALNYIIEDFDNFKLLIRKLPQILKLVDRFYELECKIIKICPHEKYEYDRDGYYGYPSKECLVCGVKNSITYDEYEIATTEEKLKEAKEQCASITALEFQLERLKNKKGDNCED